MSINIQLIFLLKSDFEASPLSRLLSSKNDYDKYFFENLLQWCKALDWDLHASNEVRTDGGRLNWKLSWIKKKSNHWDFSDLHQFDAKMKKQTSDQN